MLIGANWAKARKSCQAVCFRYARIALHFMVVGSCARLRRRDDARRDSLLVMGRNLSLRRRRFNARGLTPRNAVRWATAHFGVAGMGNRAKVELGSGNSAYQLWARAPGTGGNSITFAVVVAGASTAASVAVVGNAITFNSATSAGSAATSTVNQMIDMVNRSPAASPLVWAQLKMPGSDGTGIVAAVAATSLAGGV